MIRAIEFPDLVEFRRRQLPGSFHIDITQGGPKGAVFRFFCPCGCDAQSRLPIGLWEKPETAPSWSWNGKLSEPTLDPSVHQLNCGWHGWLRDGYWESV